MIHENDAFFVVSSLKEFLLHGTQTLPQYLHILALLRNTCMES